MCEVPDALPQRSSNVKRLPPSEREIRLVDTGQFVGFIVEGPSDVERGEDAQVIQFPERPKPDA